MGYESRIYVCEKPDYVREEEGREWAECICSFNLCGVSGRMLNRIDAFPETNLFFCDNGHETVYEDKYGKTPKEIPLADMIDILECEIVEENYRRYMPCLGLLKGFNPRQWDKLVCLHYGY